MSAAGKPDGKHPGSPADPSKREIWELRWVREPQQDRSAKTRAQLLDAAEKILETDGLEGLTIARVAGQAGCSVGSLYHHFQDKQTIIYSVMDRLANETALTAKEGLELERWKDVDLLGVLEGYLRYSLMWYRRFPGVIQAQITLAAQDPHIESRMYESGLETRKQIMKLIGPRLGEVHHPEPQLAIGVLLATLQAALRQRAKSFLPDARPAMPKQSGDAFVREMLRMAAAYLEITACTRHDEVTR